MQSAAASCKPKISIAGTAKAADKKRRRMCTGDLLSIRNVAP
jgi:hypothetical protein